MLQQRRDRIFRGRVLGGRPAGARGWFLAGTLAVLAAAALAWPGAGGPSTALARPLASAQPSVQGQDDPAPGESPSADPVEGQTEGPSAVEGVPGGDDAVEPEEEAPEDTATAAAGGDEVRDTWRDVTRPLLVLAIGMATVLGLIIGLKVNAFLALITAAMLVSLLAAGELADKIQRVAVAFGSTAGGIGIVIALAAVIGRCMLDSGAADRIVRAFVRVLGEKRSPVALMGSGFVLAVPVFFDTVFYLLVPLARSLYGKTARDYLKYILAIGAGGAITHTLVPPTPGPLTMAQTLGFDVGIMILVGGLVAFPAAVAGLLFAGVANRLMPIPMRAIGSEPEPEPLKDEELPSLFLSLLPIVLPVLLISTNTVLKAVLTAEGNDTAETVLGITGILGNANLALMLSAVVAILTLVKQRNLSRAETASIVEHSLMSGGVIILITAAGGAFGAMLKVAEVGPAIESLFPSQEGGDAGLVMLVMGFAIAALLKVAQGSSTVAMITGAGMLAGIADPALLGFHPVYLATAIGSGSLMGSWMNDSGFWIFAKMGGLTEVEALKSWTIMLLILGLVGFGMTVLLAQVLPMASAL